MINWNIPCSTNVFLLMRKKLILPLFICFTTFLFAQLENSPCGSKTYSSAYLAEHPEEAKKITELERKTKEWILENQESVSTRGIVTIPVVVHLVYNDDKYNFSDIQIQGQIDALTADFRKYNSNQNIIPDEFKERAADVEIEFCLAKVRPAPDFGPTTGIERRKDTITNNIGTALINGTKRVICYTNEGGFDAWDPTQYLNIWVGEMDGLKGEATFPGMARVPEEDGIWINVEAFSFLCNNETDFHLGKTLTHEVGHYFNLKHIFGDIENCSNDDEVLDTPLQEMRNVGCPEYPKPSTCDSGEVNEMTVNYMDFVDDDCMAMFTKGQKDRMMAALNISRSGLMNSPGCGLMNNPTTLDKNKITIFPNPAQHCFHVDLGVEADYEVRMELMSASGQRIFSKRIHSKDIRSIDISSLPNGIYFLLIENGNNFASKKIIISK